jgi:soluble cytochrome b562
MFRKPPPWRRVAAAAAAAAMAAMTVITATAGPAGDLNATTVQQRYDAARDQYEIGHFQVAFAEFASLADSGHCEAARMALQMLRYGKSMYATDFRVTPDQTQRWQRLLVCSIALARR